MTSAADDEPQLALDLTDGDPTSPLARPAHWAPPDEAARHRIATDTASTLFVEAGAGAGKTTALVGRILTLVDEGVPIESIAAITFTEKAAAELRHRLRVELGTPPVNDARLAALDGLDHAPVGTLHAFARRLLMEFPVDAGLPPGFDVLDELESQLAFDDRWQDLLDELLDDADRDVAPGLPAKDFAVLAGWAKFGGMTGLRAIAEDFQSNWDLVADRVDPVAPPRPRLDVDGLVAEAAAIAATDVPAGDKQELRIAEIGRDARVLAAVSGTIHEVEALDTLCNTAAKPWRVGAQANWKRHGGTDALDELRQREQDLSDRAAALLTAWREYRRLVVGALLSEFVLDRRSGPRRPPARWSSTTCSSWLAGSSPPDDGARISLHRALPAGAARRVPGHRPDPAGDRRPADRRPDRPTGRRRRRATRCRAGCSSSATRSSRSTGSAEPTSPPTCRRRVASAPTASI